MSNEQEREAFEIEVKALAWHPTYLERNKEGEYCSLTTKAMFELWLTRAALDTPKQPTGIEEVKNRYNFTSCEINQQGLEAARLEVVGVIQDCGTLGRVGDIIPSEEITKAALQAYLPYHNAALQGASNWQPIETAPYDTKILAIDPIGNIEALYKYKLKRVDNVEDYWLSHGTFIAVAWQPLPQPPQQQSEA